MSSHKPSSLADEHSDSSISRPAEHELEKSQDPDGKAVDIPPLKDDDQKEKEADEKKDSSFKYFLVCSLS